MPELVLKKSNQVLKSNIATLEWSSARLISYEQETVLYFTDILFVTFCVNLKFSIKPLLLPSSSLFLSQTVQTQLLSNLHLELFCEYSFNCHSDQMIILKTISSLITCSLIEKYNCLLSSYTSLCFFL